jgi:RimJ/RimL family protein N-acetyltransferase
LKAGQRRKDGPASAPDQAPSTAAVDWQPRPLRPFGPHRGSHVSIAPFDAARDAEDFVATLCGPDEAQLWTYIPMGPFASGAEVSEFFSHMRENAGWIPHVFRRPGDGRLIGTASYMRVRPEAGSAEIGCIVLSPAMQRTTAATEAMYLLARHVLFETGYRRYEWKCDNANQASKNAARRLGFAFEGVFRQDLIVRGRNRDTAWFSILDSEWPTIGRAFEAWLGPQNLDERGTQKQSLAAIREFLGQPGAEVVETTAKP